jgi:hypothetical protein
MKYLYDETDTLFVNLQLRFDPPIKKKKELKYSQKSQTHIHTHDNNLLKLNEIHEFIQTCINIYLYKMLRFRLPANCFSL